MRCPFCGYDDTVVKDSRPAEDGTAIRRRRGCPGCGARFSTLERVQLRELTVLKSNNSREPFERDKLMRSLKLALRKRPVDDDKIERVASSILRQLETSGETEVTSTKIGAMALDALETLDPVGFIRYASVYEDFRNAGDFNAFIDRLKTLPQQENS